MLTAPEHCDHPIEHRQVAAASVIDSGCNGIPFQEAHFLVVCLNCGKAEGIK